MKTLQTDILIIGAGLTGLTTAYYLKKQGYNSLIVEARSRLGGRIHTADYNSNRPIELGATWLGVKHQQLCQLLEELGIETFEQIIGDKVIYEAISTSPPYLASLPPNPEPSLRIAGGTYALIEKLSEQLDPNSILLDTTIRSLSTQDSHLLATNETLQIICNKVISTLPPNLLVNTIQCTPELPAELVTIAEQTHTWMSDSIKIALRFAEPFWRNEKSSGTIMSNVGPIPEMYDHCNVEENHYALMGFLNGAFHSLTRTERLDLVKKQLKKYYGSVIDQLLSYHETVWRVEAHSFYPYEGHVLPHQNNGHQLFHRSYLKNRLFIAGTETSSQYPGYMEGAILSAKAVTKRILEEV